MGGDDGKQGDKAGAIVSKRLERNARSQRSDASLYWDMVLHKTSEAKYLRRSFLPLHR